MIRLIAKIVFWFRAERHTWKFRCFGATTSYITFRMAWWPGTMDVLEQNRKLIDLMNAAYANNWELVSGPVTIAVPHD